jgi:hypothetical protein
LSIKFKDNKLLVSELEFEDPEVIESFKEIKAEDLEYRFRLAVKVGALALKTVATTERVDYIQKEFNKLDSKFNETLKVTSEQLSDSIDDFFGEEGKVNTLMENHLGEKGTFAEQLERHFGKDGKIVKELFDPLKEGTPLNVLRTMLDGELKAIKDSIVASEATKNERAKGTQKGKDFEDICEDLLSDIVRNHKGDIFQRTTTVKGQITNSKKGDFVVDVTGKTEHRIVVEAKDMSGLSLSKINQEIDEALKNRGAKFGIFVSKWNEALPSSVGCFNYYNDDRVVCSLGSKDDELLHEEILHAAYCWARSNILKKSNNCSEIDFEVIDNNLDQVKSQLNLFSTIKSHCTNINSESKKIVEAADDIETKIRTNLLNISQEMHKGKEKEIEA